ncbi:MAG: aminotransferase class V-fold PLP-dependent enzyme, partial [Clostridiales bacterium]|nr:aminotransferase class V-fold PLP-dependent enzyme [Candidatus Equinaster intestinalis]
EDSKMEVEERLIYLVKAFYNKVDYCIGYPVCQSPNMAGFGEWYAKTGLCDIATNNVGNPFDDEQLLLNATLIEREVIQTFSRLYGIPEGKEWGFVTNSGTDGNMHGIYFGAKKLQKETGMLPLVYISKEAHYSSSRLCDVQNLETRMIDYDKQGRMDPESLRKNLDPSRPALIVFAIGSTFMGATDDQAAIQKVLDEVKPIAVYKHLDGALFGGYFPFTEYKDLVNMEKQGYDSIAISGHKFFGIDEPCGLFLSRKDVLAAQQAAKVEYLNNDMPLISCSRSAVAPLKFYWILQHMGYDAFEKEADSMLKNTKYLQEKFDEIGYPAWHMPYSNTVFFKRPPEWIRQKYSLANGFLPEYGGELSHIVVMQHVKKNIIDDFIADLVSSQNM